MRGWEIYQCSNISESGWLDSFATKIAAMNLSTIAISIVELQKEIDLKTKTCPSNEKHTARTMKLLTEHTQRDTNQSIMIMRTSVLNL